MTTYGKGLEDAKMRLEMIREVGACASTTLNFFEEPTPFSIRMMCDGCGIRDLCLDYAMFYERYGYWGGTTEDDRMRMRKVRHIGLTDVFTRQPHSSATINPRLRDFTHGLPGTGGYRRHRRRGEPPCAECLEQFNMVERRKRAEERENK